METVIRNCYKEAGIKSANAVIIEARETVINKILKENILKDDEWLNLSKWIIGIECEQIEDILITLEKEFCSEDSQFSINNTKELQILSGILVYKYCIENEIIKLPLIIICGNNSGFKLQNNSLYLLFEEYVSEQSLNFRNNKTKQVNNKNSQLTKLKKLIVTDQKEASEKEAEWVCSSKIVDSLLEVLGEYEKTFANMIAKMDNMGTELEVQKEELDILWWMINEWSDIYNKSFKELKSCEAVLAAPIELSKLIKFLIGPYASREVLHKLVSLSIKQSKKLTLSEVVSNANVEILNQISLYNSLIYEIHPILSALKFKNDCKNNNDTWKILFKNKINKEPDAIEFNDIDLAYQFYLELELADILNK